MRNLSLMLNGDDQEEEVEGVVAVVAVRNKRHRQRQQRTERQQPLSPDSHLAMRSGTFFGLSITYTVLFWLVASFAAYRLSIHLLAVILQLCVLLTSQSLSLSLSVRKAAVNFGSYCYVWILQFLDLHDCKTLTVRVTVNNCKDIRLLYNVGSNSYATIYS
jgi:hypothetical protein